MGRAKEKKVAMVEIYVILAYFAFYDRRTKMSRNNQCSNFAQNLPGSFIDIKQVSNPPYHLDILDTPF